MNIRYDKDLFDLKLPIKKFDPRFGLENFETRRLAEKKQRYLADLFSDGGERFKYMHRRMLTCKPGARCRSAACPVCFRKPRIRYCGGVVASHIANDGRDWSAVTLVEKGDECWNLRRFDTRDMKGRLRKRLSRSKLCDLPVYAGIDIMVDVTRGGIFRPHWYMLIPATRVEIYEALNRFYPTSMSVERPIVVKRINKAQVLAPATYMLKSTYKAWVYVTDHNGEKVKDNVDMPETYLQMILPVLHDWGYVSRIFQMNL